MNKSKISFEWDEKKNNENVIKHSGISFDDAKMVFYDENALLIYDDEHSSNEDRFILIGKTPDHKELVVCHCVRIVNQVEIIRIINAREANKTERRAYYER